MRMNMLKLLDGDRLAPTKTAAPVAAPSVQSGLSMGASAAQASLPGMSWDDYSKNISGMGFGGASGWNNREVTNGFEALGREFGYNGPVQERTGNQIYSGETDSGASYTDEYGPSAGLAEVLKNYRFADSNDAGGNSAMKVYDSAGNPIGGDRRIASSGGSFMKFMGTAVPLLVGAGFGFGGLEALGLLGGGGAAGAAEAAGLAGTGADAATSAAWANGAAGLGGDTLTAMGMGEAGTLGTSGLGAMRAGELAGYATNGSMPLSAATAEGGGMLGSLQATAGQVGSAISGNPVSAWMRENPVMGRLITSGAGALMSGAGGGGSSATAGPRAPAKQWSSGLTMGPQAPFKPTSYPGAVSAPTAIPASGYQNSGAWRYMKG